MILDSVATFFAMCPIIEGRKRACSRERHEKVKFSLTQEDKVARGWRLEQLLRFFRALKIKLAVYIHNSIYAR